MPRRFDDRLRVQVQITQRRFLIFPKLIINGQIRYTSFYRL